MSNNDYIIKDDKQDLSKQISILSCNGHGQCRVSGEGQWECRCYEGWDGTQCGVQLEVNCGDNKDNDKGNFPLPLYNILILS